MTKKVKKRLQNHGMERNDDYAWIRDVADPDTIPTLTEENKATATALSHLEPLQKEIYTEIIGRILEDDEEYPFPIGDYEYFYRMEKGKNYPIYVRKKIGTPNEEIILDLNKKVQGHSYIHLSDYKISPDQTKIAYGLDYDGSEHYKIFIEDIATKEIVDQYLENTTGNFEWGDNCTLYYGRMDEAHRPYRVFKHTVHMKVENDYLMYEDNNPSYYVGIDKSESGRFLWIESGSKITTEVSFIDFQSCDRAVQLFCPRQENIKYDVSHQEDRFIIRTNENAENFKLLQTPVSNFQKSNWKELLPYDSNRTIEGVQIFKNYVVTSERFDGLQNFRVISKDRTEDISFDEPFYAVGLEHNKIYDSEFVRFNYSSMKTPPRIQTYNMRDKNFTTLKEKRIPSYNADQYITERLFAPSRDGKHTIPISIIYKNTYKKDGKAPLFLYGYGSYGMSRNPSFSPSIFSLLDRGFAYAIAHIRGGAERGRSWYNDGKLQKKKNTFYDFIDSAKFLIEQKYTSEKKIAMCGGSAGGLLMGATLNMEPNLWGAVVALVPFVDVINTMLDESLPLTITEYDEWGNPNQKESFEYIASYSPYENIQKNHFPSILATGGLHDPRVGFWEPAKWVFKLREHQLAKNPILLKIQMEAGHQGPSGRYEAYRETSIYYSFVIDELSKISLGNF